MVSTVVAEKARVGGPKFRDIKDLPPESLNDPDYHLKQIVKLAGGKITVTCSKCHHCR